MLSTSSIVAMTPSLSVRDLSRPIRKLILFCSVLNYEDGLMHFNLLGSSSAYVNGIMVLPSADADEPLKTRGLSGLIRI